MHADVELQPGKAFFFKSHPFPLPTLMKVPVLQDAEYLWF